jgi:diketogulonate reductase-like aldo/keto reductase
MGGTYDRDFSNNDKADIDALKKAIDLGITHIDTAEVYAKGHSEELVGQAIAGYDRKKLFIVSKALDENLAYDNLIHSCKKSLARLRTNYLDLYLAHRYNPSIDLQETIEAMDELVSQGLVKHIGVSNFSWEHLKQAQEFSKNKIVCNQVHYNLMFREPEKSGLLDFCQQNDIFLVAWRPVGKGELLQNIPSVFKEICDKYQKTPAQVAINWLISQSNVLTLSKTSTVEHLKENLGAVGWEMEKVDIERLRQEFPNQKHVSNVVPLG